MQTTEYVTYGDGRNRSLTAHVGKNKRRVFIDGKYAGTARKLGVPGGNYRSPGPGRPLRQSIPGASHYRTAVLARDGGCVVTGTPADARIYSKGKSIALIQAAHIKPRKLCEPGEYWDLDNGLAMRADIHAAFDAGLFTIGDNGAIIPSRWMQDYYPPVIVTNLTDGQRKYLEGHRAWCRDNWSRWAFA